MAADMRATVSILPIDHIARSATANLLVCASHADRLMTRARDKGLHVNRIV